MCYFINIRMRKIEKGEMSMLNEEICKLRDKLNKTIFNALIQLRDKLNKSIENGDDYAITYKLSVELDELIAKYYRDSKKNYDKANV